MIETNDYHTLLRRGAEHSEMNEKLRAAVARMATNIVAAFGGDNGGVRGLPNGKQNVTGTTIYFVDKGVLFCSIPYVTPGVGQFYKKNALNPRPESEWDDVNMMSDRDGPYFATPSLKAVEAFAKDVATDGILQLWSEELRKLDEKSAMVVALCDAIDKAIRQ